MTEDTFPLTARNARVLATTIAALDDKPEPAGTVPVKSKSTAAGDSGDDEGKYLFNTPYQVNVNFSIQRDCSRHT